MSFGQVLGSRRIEVDRPVESRGQGAEVRAVLLVVAEGPIPALDAIPVMLGEPRLQVHHLPGRLGRLGPAGQGEHPLHVRDERIPDGLELRVAVIGLVRQADPALREVDDLPVRLLGIGGHEQPEHSRRSPGAGARPGAEEPRLVLDGVDPGELVLDRLETLLLDLLLVHEPGIQDHRSSGPRSPMTDPRAGRPPR